MVCRITRSRTLTGKIWRKSRQSSWRRDRSRPPLSSSHPAHSRISHGRTPVERRIFLITMVRKTWRRNEKDALGIYFRDGFSRIFSDRFFHILFICLSFLRIKLLLTFFGANLVDRFLKENSWISKCVCSVQCGYSVLAQLSDYTWYFFDWLIGWSVDWLFVFPVHWLIDRSVDWLFVFPVHWLIDWLR